MGQGVLCRRPAFVEVYTQTHEWRRSSRFKTGQQIREFVGRLWQRVPAVALGREKPPCFILGEDFGLVRRRQIGPLDPDQTLSESTESRVQKLLSDPRALRPFGAVELFKQPLVRT